MPSDNYPYTPVREALETVFGRVCVILFAMFVGSICGGWTATHSAEGLRLATVGLPGLCLASILYGSGLVIFGIIALYAFASIVLEWPLILSVACSFLMWWNVHMAVRWALRDSPAATQQLLQHPNSKLDLGETIKRAVRP